MSAYVGSSKDLKDLKDLTTSKSPLVINGSSKMPAQEGLWAVYAWIFFAAWFCPEAGQALAFREASVGGIQRYLAHKKTHPPRTLPSDDAQGTRGVPREARFLMSEVDLYTAGSRRARGPLLNRYRGTSLIRKRISLGP